ncbi:MAG TPA: hypothetical protein VIZ58_07915 [Thermoanaerobaculia bacterium]
MSENSVPAGTVYGVWADQSTLRRESLGPLFGRVSLDLRGTMDHVWESCYVAIRHDAEQFSRFVLDVRLGRVSFTCRASESVEDIQEALARLTLLLELVNLQATTTAASASADERRRA